MNATDYTSSMVLTHVIIAVGEVAVATISGYCLFKVAQLKSHVNSRMDELLDVTRTAAFAKGKLQAENDARAVENAK